MNRFKLDTDMYIWKKTGKRTQNRRVLIAFIDLLCYTSPWLIIPIFPWKRLTGMLQNATRKQAIGIIAPVCL